MQIFHTMTPSCCCATVSGQQITEHFSWPDTILSVLWFTATLSAAVFQRVLQRWNITCFVPSTLPAEISVPVDKSRTHCKLIILTNTTTVIATTITINQLGITTWQWLYSSRESKIKAFLFFFNFYSLFQTQGDQLHNITQRWAGLLQHRFGQWWQSLKLKTLSFEDIRQHKQHKDAFLASWNLRCKTVGWSQYNRFGATAGSETQCWSTVHLITIIQIAYLHYWVSLQPCSGFEPTELWRNGNVSRSSRRRTVSKYCRCALPDIAWPEAKQT